MYQHALFPLPQTKKPVTVSAPGSNFTCDL
jgi:hypothetical protein